MRMRAGREIGMAVLIAGGVLMPIVACASQQRGTEHPANTQQRLALEASTYWFYEAMGKLEQVKTVNGHVEGQFTERMRVTRFTVPSEQLGDATARTAGYV